MVRRSTEKSTGESAHATDPRADFPLASRTGYLLHKAGMVILEDVDRALEAVSLKVRHFLVLAALSGGPELSQQDLSRLLLLDPTTVVALIDDLEQAGYVERRRNPNDRRRYILVLTDAGRATLAEADQVVGKAEADFLAAVPVEQQEQLRTMLGALLADRWPTAVCS